MEIATFQHLTKIHPIRNLRRLVCEITHTLTKVTGLQEGEKGYVSISSIETREQIASLDWIEIFRAIKVKTPHERETAIAFSLDCARLLLERAELQFALYGDAKHFYTLALTTPHRYRLPQIMSQHPGIQADLDYFHQVMRHADASLEAGRATLEQFQHLALEGAPFPALQKIINQTHEHLAAYTIALALGNKLFEALSTYVADLKSSHEDVPSLAA